MKSVTFYYFYMEYNFNKLKNNTSEFKNCRYIKKLLKVTPNFVVQELKWAEIKTQLRE